MAGRRQRQSRHLSVPDGCDPGRQHHGDQNQGRGNLSVYPSGASRPTTSNANFGTRQTVANLAILSTTGPYQEVAVYNGSTGSADVIFDAFGYFASN